MVLAFELDLPSCIVPVRIVTVLLAAPVVADVMFAFFEVLLATIQPQAVVIFCFI